MNTEDRLVRLEKANLRWRWIVGGMAAVMVVVAAIAAKPREEGVVDVLRGRRLEIVNENGVAVLWLQTDKAGNGVAVVANAKGTAEVGMHGGEFGGTINVFRNDEKLAAAMSVVNDSGVMNVYQNGKVSAGLMAGNSGGMLQINNENDEMVASVYSTERGGGVSVMTAAGKAAGGLTVGKIGGALILCDDAGTPSKVLDAR